MWYSRLQVYLRCSIFYKECINHDIKPILGCSFDNFSLFAKNKDGWFDLIKLVSSLDKDNNINTKVLLSICTKGNLISIAKNEVDSPITGQDFYVKSSAFMDIYYANRRCTPTQYFTVLFHEDHSPKNKIALKI